MSVLKEWSAQLSFKEFEIYGSFSIFIFLGPVPADPAQWRSDPTCAGVYYVYGGGSVETPSDHEERRKHGYVQLNRAIAKHANFESFEPDLVVPFLKTKINWGVVQVIQFRLLLVLRS